MYTVSIKTHFSSAHRLRNYNGACENIHGHNWQIEVAVETDKLNDLGMAIDFKDLKTLSSQVVSKLDHRNLNDIPPFDTQNPTAENIARYFYYEIGKKLPEDVKMKRVTIWETEKYSLIYAEN